MLGTILGNRQARWARYSFSLNDHTVSSGRHTAKTYATLCEKQKSKVHRRYRNSETTYYQICLGYYEAVCLRKSAESSRKRVYKLHREGEDKKWFIWAEKKCEMMNWWKVQGTENCIFIKNIFKRQNVKQYENNWINWKILT